MSSSAPDPQRARRLRRLVESAVAAYEQRGVAGLEESLRDAGDEAGAVRARLEMLRQSGLLAEEAPAREETSAGEGRALPPSLGEFVPLEKLGEGAMGIVWRAEQPSLRRQVALKVIRPEYTWIEGARERFRREAEAVARLQHPAIVPVYAVGEENGVSYLAFELVEGLALDRLLEELARRGASELRGEHALAIIAERDGRGALPAGVPALFRGRWIEVVVRLLQELADALAHAHERGILHRDLKPSNVMLTRDGAVRLLDFGLAAAEGAPSLTREGAAPGSLAYMAPELLAAEGARADVRSEVYALGVCAYELLRLRPPFEGRSMLEVRARILRGDFEALRTSRDGLPWELLAIVETAMERAPQRRYADLRAFAEDLRRFAAREPIAARRSGPLRRGARWIQRHPVAATALSLGALLLTAVPSAIAVQQARDAATVRGALEQAKDAGARSEQNVLALL
ncbi:MAG: serine/threonine protein kinase, partial [Planctomycetes bacterium]|nr:serine/threonine protein kinase [Planctomycetota bacterium]